VFADGFFWEPAIERFALQPEQKKTVVIKMRPIAPGRQEKWITGDEHMHLMRAKEDDEVFLKWLRAEDLNVGMFLTGMRQQHFGVQYDWGREGEARMPGFSIRSGQETRSEFTVTLVFTESPHRARIGSMYSNTPRPSRSRRRISKTGSAGATGFCPLSRQHAHSQLCST
jgi:hypothetical protein